MLEIALPLHRQRRFHRSRSARGLSDSPNAHGLAERALQLHRSQASARAPRAADGVMSAANDFGREAPFAPDENGKIIPCTDLANAARFIDLHGADLRWVGSWNKWLAWDGKRWERDERNVTFERAKDAARVMA